MLYVQLDYLLLDIIHLLNIVQFIHSMIKFILHLLASKSHTLREPDDDPDTILSSFDENVILLIADVCPVKLFNKIVLLN